ncbi:hypothetical protein HDV57DRAFT_489272 [Trichoderma longibrachiatum]
MFAHVIACIYLPAFLSVCPVCPPVMTPGQKPSWPSILSPSFTNFLFRDTGSWRAKSLMALQPLASAALWALALPG